MTIDPVGTGQSESPVGNTVHNLVHTLSVKLDSAHRYGLYQDDARSGRDTRIVRRSLPTSPSKSGR